MKTAARTLARVGKLLPVFVLFQTLGCLPDNALREVFAQNLVRTFSVVTQSFVAIIFGNLFPF